jgi:hypothetical protein
MAPGVFFFGFLDLFFFKENDHKSSGIPRFISVREKCHKSKP